MNTGFSLDPVQEQRDNSEPHTQREPNQKMLDLSNRPRPQAIEFRIEQLQNRRFLLLRLEGFRKKAEDNGAWNKDEMSCEDNDQLCELEAIQKELEELLIEKKELERQGNLSKQKANEGQQDTHLKLYNTETPYGGIYMLPTGQLTGEDIALGHRVNVTGPVTPVDCLGRTPAITKCPSCEEVILTETQSKVGASSWMTCCLCVIIGCAAGCCLLPFCMKCTRDVQHQCPKCQAKIHTHQPL